MFFQQFLGGCFSSGVLGCHPGVLLLPRGLLHPSSRHHALVGGWWLEEASPGGIWEEDFYGCPQTQTSLSFPLGPKGRESRQHNPVLDSGESTLSSNTAPSESPSSFPNLHPPNTNPGLLLGSPNPTNLPGRAPGSLLPWCLPVPPPPWGSTGGCGWPRGFTAPPSQHPLGRLTAVSRGEVPVHL